LYGCNALGGALCFSPKALPAVFFKLRIEQFVSVPLKPTPPWLEQG
jgi:hypothetical protein